ncbi:hypothetical protein MJ1HA_0406 [Metallosphaera sedula]|nr:hypothetical protein MJ1HA_0406 [Metallosphaera sedula]
MSSKFFWGNLVWKNLDPKNSCVAFPNQVPKILPYFFLVNMFK